MSSARDATAVFSDYAQDYDAPRRRLIPVFDEFYGVAVDCLRLTAGRSAGYSTSVPAPA